MAKKIKNHIVPQVYLKQFAIEDGKETVWAFNKRECNEGINTKQSCIKDHYYYAANVRSICYREKYYSSSAEDYLGSSIEGDFNTIIHMLEKEFNTMTNPSECCSKDNEYIMKFLKKYIGIQFVRDHQGLDMIRGLMDYKRRECDLYKLNKRQIFDETCKLLGINNISNIDDIYSNYLINSNKYKFMQNLLIELDANRNYDIHLCWDVMNIYRCNLAVIKMEENKLMTCDSPVVLMENYTMFPLSKNIMCIALSSIRTDSFFIQKNNVQYEEFNRLAEIMNKEIVDQAEDWIISAQNNNEYIHTILNDLLELNSTISGSKKSRNDDIVSVSHLHKSDISLPAVGIDQIQQYAIKKNSILVLDKETNSIEYMPDVDLHKHWSKSVNYLKSKDNTIESKILECEKKFLDVLNICEKCSYAVITTDDMFSLAKFIVGSIKMCVVTQNNNLNDIEIIELIKTLDTEALKACNSILYGNWVITIFKNCTRLNFVLTDCIVDAMDDTFFGIPCKNAFISLNSKFALSVRMLDKDAKISTKLNLRYARVIDNTTVLNINKRLIEGSGRYIAAINKNDIKHSLDGVESNRAEKLDVKLCRRELNV